MSFTAYVQELPSSVSVYVARWRMGEAVQARGLVRRVRAKALVCWARSAGERPKRTTGSGFAAVNGSWMARWSRYDWEAAIGRRQIVGRW
jgi:hypothetical protein